MIVRDSIPDKVTNVHMLVHVPGRPSFTDRYLKSQLMSLTDLIILAVKLIMINQDRMIFGDFSVYFEPIFL